MADLRAVTDKKYTPQAAQNIGDESLQVEQVRRWPSESGNDKWLLIFDNYDDQNLPGTWSPVRRDVRLSFPRRSQGSIIRVIEQPYHLSCRSDCLAKLIATKVTIWNASSASV